MNCRLFLAHINCLGKKMVQFVSERALIQLAKEKMLQKENLKNPLVK
jgi:hypothetical protein